MIYVEVKQKTIKASTISFSGNTISDSANGLVDFVAGDKFLVHGSINGTNDIQRNIVSASASSIVVDGPALSTESAGSEITIYKIEFYSDNDIYKNDERGNLKFFYPNILNIGEVSYTSDGAWSRLNDGYLSIHRKSLQGEDGKTNFDLQDKTKLFEFLVKSTYDDSIIFQNVVGIIRGLSEMIVSFQLKTELPDSDWLEDAADINTGATYTQGRYLPKVIGTVYHFDPLLQYDTTYQYYSGGTYVYSVYDDGVVVPFTNFASTSYSIGDAVKYNGIRYTAAVTNPTISPTGGATSNAGWNYSATAVTTEPQFQAVAYNFTLVSAPSGRVTIDVSGEFNTLNTLSETLAGLVKVPNQEIYSNGISFDNATSKILDSNNLLGSFVGNGTNITGQRILIEGSASNNTYFRVTSASAGELTVSPAPTTESSGANIKIIGFYGFSSEYSDGTAAINYPYSTQQKVINVLKEIADFHEHIFYFDKINKLMYLIDKEDSSGTLIIDEFDIDLEDSVTYLTKEVIFSFTSDWVQNIPVINPTQLLEQKRTTEVLTGVETGTIKNVIQLENNNTSLISALEKKRDLYLNYDRIELNYTKDNAGLDFSLMVGKKIEFSSWISGDLFVQEFILDIESGRNTARGIANNIAFQG